MARRVKSLHHGKDWFNGDKNVVAHREHRSKRGRTEFRIKGMPEYHGRSGKKATWRTKDYSRYRSDELNNLQ